MKKIILTEEVWKEGKMYVAYSPELDIPATGRSIKEAKKNLLKVIHINFDEMKKMGTLMKFLKERGFLIDSKMIWSTRQIIEFSPLEVRVEAV